MFFNTGQTLILATHNRGKSREIKDLLKEHGLIILDGHEAQLPEAIEDGSSFEENALIKSRQAAAQTGLPALADDSGLAIDALDGAPGIYSARYGGDGQPFSKAIERVLNELKPHKNRKARFISVLALTYPHKTGEENHCFCGSISGSVAFKILGREGFGYDPIFIPHGYQKTFAQLSHNDKNKISHRARSFMLFRQAMLPSRR